jgi:hypothetical protein
VEAANGAAFQERMQTMRSIVFVMGLALMAVAVAGCEPTSGRVGIGETTGPETQSREVLPTALVEFSDQGARQLVGDLNDISRLRETDGRVTILLGDLNNQTQVTSTNDFEMMSQRLRDRLINSEHAREHLRFVADRRRMRDLARKEEVGSREGYEGPEAYDPQRTYTLNGDFYRVSRGETNQYYMRFELNHFASGETVFANSYDLKQVRD